VAQLFIASRLGKDYCEIIIDEFYWFRGWKFICRVNYPIKLLELYLLNCVINYMVK
jgi:hypothetical protein